MHLTELPCKEWRKPQVFLRIKFIIYATNFIIYVPFVLLPDCLFNMCLSTVCQSIYQSMCLCFCPTICSFVSISFCLSMFCLPVHISIKVVHAFFHSFFYLFVSQSFCLTSANLSICLTVCLSNVIPKLLSAFLQNPSVALGNKFTSFLYGYCTRVQKKKKGKIERKKRKEKR